MSTPFWDRVARLPGLSPVVDYAPEQTTWACYLTALHLTALGQMARFKPTDLVLDLGCGVGRITSWLAPRVARVIAVDPSRPMIEEARRRCRQDNVDLLLLEGSPPALPLSRLDAAVVIWVLQHILDPDLFEATLDLLARVVRPGGALYTLDRLTREQVDDAEQDDGYIRLRTRQEYLQALASKGFTLRQARHVFVGEQVLGRPGLTRLARRWALIHPLLLRADLLWARRQQEPFIADTLWHLRRE